MRSILFLFLALLCMATPAAAAPAPRPNVVVILLDDMGFSDFSSYGGEIPTPNIDALAAGGLRFTQFYNSARCSPTRAALLTGLNPHQAGMGYLSGLRLPDSRGLHGRLDDRAVTIAEVLRNAGYFTAMTGKWHLGNSPGTTPATRGFDRSLSAVAGGIYFPDQVFRDEHTRKRVGPRYLLLDGKRIELDDPILGEGWYGTVLWTEWGMRFIDEARGAQKPFFLYLAHVAPHFPLMAPEADIARFRGRYSQGWDALRKARFARQREMGLLGPEAQLTPILPSASHWDELTAAQKDRFDEMMAIYAATISRVDQSVGALVAHLKQTGEFDNTLILVLSDNGGNAESGPWGRTGDKPWGGPTSNVYAGMNWAQLQNTPFRFFKHFTAEGGIAAPLIAHWPQGIANRLRGGFERTPAHVIDLAPTLYRLAGARYPATFDNHAILPLEGIDLSPLFGGNRVNRDAPLFWEHEGNYAIRDGRWKAIKRLGHNWELYDMERDRSEMHDLASEQLARVRRMAAKWDEWAQRTFVDPWPESAPRSDWGAPHKAAAIEAVAQDD